MHGTKGADLSPRNPIEGVEYPPVEEAERRIGSGAWAPETIGGVVAGNGLARGSATGVVDGERRLTYGQLDELSAAAALRFLGAGLKPGDRVLTQVGTSTAAVVGLLGLFRAGLVPVCAVPRYRAYEMGALADLSGARAHLVEPGTAGDFDLLAFADQLRRDHSRLERLLITGAAAPDGWVAAEAAGPAAAGSLPAVSPLDVAAFQLSGGTTGVPKIIPRFHAEYLSYARSWAERLGLTEADAMLWSLPLAHNAGMICWLLPALLSNAKLVLMSRFDAEAFMATIAEERISVTGSIGPIAPRLLDLERPDRFDAGSVRLFITLNRAREIEAHLGVPAMNIYGITEGILCASAPGAPESARHGTIGRPSSPHDEVRVLARDGGDEAGPGGLGELCFRGPSVIRAYYGNPEATAAAFTPDGFFRSGDLVRVHEIDGRAHFSFEGRVKDNIDRGGEKFGTEEIEALLGEHEDLLAACVVGMPDPYLGERVCAFVIVRPGADLPGVEDLSSFLLASGLAKFKLPERIEEIDELPVTNVGKLDRAALRQRIAAKLDKEG